MLGLNYTENELNIDLFMSWALTNIAGATKALQSPHFCEMVKTEFSQCVRCPFGQQKH